MLTAVSIENLRGIRSGTLEGLTPLVVLVGPNGSGKSTVLDALSFGATDSPADAVAQAVLRRGLVSRGATWLVRGGRPGVQARVITTAGPDAKREQVVQVGRLTAVPASLETPVDGLLLEERDRGRLQQTTRILFGANLRALLVGSYGDERSPNPRRIIVDGALAARGLPLHDLYSETVTVGREPEALALIRSVDSSIRELKILTQEGAPALHLVREQGSVPAEAAGDGMAALLRIVFELATRTTDVVLLEEPESHQHPAAIREIGRAIVAAVRRNVQVILSTHSLEVLDALLAALAESELPLLTVYQLRLDPRDGALSHASLAGADVALARSAIDQDLR